MFELTPVTKISTWEVLRRKFPETEYVLISEVSDAAGFDRSRSLDYMLINLWTSRGLAVTGIERKSNRSDWLKEKANPKKQENHFKYCDYFYLLTDKEGVAKIDEIPEKWGWYHINERGILKILKPAPKLTPIPIERSIMCAMFKRAASKEKYVHVDSIKDEINKAYEKGLAEHKSGRDRVIEEAAKNQKMLDDFKEASGMALSAYRWNGVEPKAAGLAIKFFCEHGIDFFKKELQKTANSMEANLKIVNETLSKL